MIYLAWIIPLVIIVTFLFVLLLKLDAKERERGDLPVFLRDDTIIPDEIKGYNWSAFLLGPIWVIGNKIGLAFLIIYFIPFGGGWGQLVYSFVLGFNANKLSWKSKKWESIEEFKENQKKWNRAAIIATPIGVVLFSALYCFIFYFEMAK